MGALILDASVLIALLDTADAHHTRAVEEVDDADRQGSTLIVPASAYSKALVAFARAERIGDAREAIAAMGITVAPLDAAISEAAAVLRAAHDRLRLPDAIVLATAVNLHARLLSYDKRLERYANDEVPGTDTLPGRADPQ
jgi:predicted nucleic acid-binding protein